MNSQRSSVEKKMTVREKRDRKWSEVRGTQIRIAKSGFLLRIEK